MPPEAYSSFTEASQKCHLLDSLPTELIIRCIALLDFRTLVACRQLCRIFRTFIDETAVTKYKIELGAAGMEDGPPSAFSTAARLQKLKTYQSRWEKLEWVEEKQIPMEVGEVWELYGGVLAQGRGSRTLKFWQLPSVTRGIEFRSWEIEDTGALVRDFGMDPSQGLLVLIVRPPISPVREGRVCYIHLRALDTGGPHPLVPGSSAILEHVQNLRPGHRVSYTIQVSGCYLGVMFHRHGGLGNNDLVIWNWRTGHRQMLLTTNGPGLRSFAFLSDRHVMVSTIKDALADPPFRLAILDFKEASGELVGLDRALCSFMLPPLEDDSAESLEFIIRSDPAPTYIPDPDLHLPFFTSQDKRIFVLTMYVTSGAFDNAVASFILFIPYKTLMAQLQTPRPMDWDKQIPWDDWGPRGTRLIRDPGQSLVWVCYICGMRYVVAQLNPSVQEDSVWLDVYDFNEISFNRALKAQDEEGNNSSDDRTIYVTDPTVLQVDGVFEHGVQTTLPYRKRSVQLDIADEDFIAAMISEDNLVTIYRPDNRRFCLYTF
ncbi:hypothetical protein PLICRDRAFT_49798 [Plicaturopsis crispa FD-325 SS-3]|nr:hypothetical protein PLICRDRAFT_49798 [Plicaturopsis crispa FD-325 SS-3]